MTPAAVNRLDNGHDAELSDCAICSLACYLGIAYPEILRAATLIDKRHMGRTGLTVRAIRKVAEAFGVTLVRKRTVDWDEDYALVVTPTHAAVLRNGLILDRLQVWEWEPWLVDQKVSAGDCALYVVQE